MNRTDRTLIISTSVAAAALLVAYGVVPAVCAVLLALYAREHMLRTAATSALRQLAVQLEYEASSRRRLEDMLESRFLMRGLSDIFGTDDKGSLH
ncbi:hypothetical protein [Gellertiella hungarica]|uniref:Uncharacterized protein n=1 Tax=Gellertiella hungarica TaxID=1572859 RepID=A0A7W6J523_9HYPH|nr:hypothetical protein [Gellertiella hungarica]MBB4064023.1 hypothetical protein [Gellertiella hungarica]